MFAAILIILSLIFLDNNKVRGFQFRPLSKVAVFTFAAIFVALMILGAKHVESPYIEYGQFNTIMYFVFFLVILPLISYQENAMISYALFKKSFSK
jgi:ubiquinol-cytochrome c reductase cytochrome b subunit